MGLFKNKVLEQPPITKFIEQLPLKSSRFDRFLLPKSHIPTTSCGRATRLIELFGN
jgi:hypothetical protein